MVVDLNFIEAKRQQRTNKIKSLVAKRNCSYFEAEIFVDMNAPKTTNRKQLTQAGMVDIDEVTSDNFYDIIEAMSLMGIEVRKSKNAPREFIMKTLEIILDEEVPEFWGGPGVREIVEIGNYSTFQSN